MNHIQDFAFFKDIEGIGESNIFKSFCYTDGTIEFKGDAESFEAEIQACIDMESEPNWVALSVLNESNLNMGNTISEKGLYSFNAMGKNIRVKINSISGGKLTVVGKFLN